MCDFQIHEQLRDILEHSCPFCDQVLVEIDKVTDKCCDKQCIENLNGIQICVHCGLTHSCVYDTGYHDFYANLHKINKKSIYIRFYHIQNVLNKICSYYMVDLKNEQRDKIYKIFKLIGTVIPKINNTTRKRLISINYILKMIFIMFGIPSENIPISKSSKTLAYYSTYWTSIMTLIGDKIQSIIDHKSGYMCYPIDS